MDQQPDEPLEAAVRRELQRLFAELAAASGNDQVGEQALGAALPQAQ